MKMIVGFSIKSIVAERKNIPKGRIDINSTPKIVSITKSKREFINKDTPLSIEFEFFTRYEPDIGIIKIMGNVFYISKKMNDIIKTWNKEKKIRKEVDMEIKNFLFRKCLSIGLNLSENMQLPPPLMFPRVVPKTFLNKKADLKYIG